MNLGAPAMRAGALRRALRAAYGLWLEGLSDDQLLAAAAPLGGGHPALAPAGALARALDALPIAESWMFRDEPLWSWLQGELLPGLVLDARSAGRPLRAVSLGCSSGEEAYSLAVLLLARLEADGVPASRAGARASVLGLDASPARVAQARRGQASAGSVARCPPRWLGGRVRPLDADGGRWQVDEAVRALCRFEVGNLLEVARPGSAALRGADLVLCRHVLGYFRPEEAGAVVEGLARALDPGATLVLAPAEAHLASGRPGLEPAAAGAFRRVAVEATPARPARTVTLAAGLGRVAGARGDGAPDPGGLLSRLVLGRELLTVDHLRGRAVLADLVELTGTLPAGASVPHAPGLSVGQLTSAALRLMARAGPR